MKAPRLSITIGSDPELMLVSNKTGKPCSAIPVLKNDKTKPIDLKDGIFMYADNALVEFRFPPCYTKQVFLQRMRSVFIRAQAKLGKEYSLLPQAAYRFEADDLKEDQAWEIGCNPNFDVYAETCNCSEEFKDTLRSGSMHIHIGNSSWDSKLDHSDKLLTSRSKHNAVKIMDLHVGLASIVFDRDETSTLRKSLYGKAGEFRPTPYGVEYRVLGNYALRSPDLTGLVIDLTENAMDFISTGAEEDVFKGVDFKEVQHAINSGNRTLARQLLQEVSLSESLLNRIDLCSKRTPEFYKDWVLPV